MKILNVVTHLDPVTGGGCTERTFQMSRYLARNGVETSILTTDYRLTTERRHELREIQVNALPCLMSRYYIPRILWHRIKQAVAESDMIHLIGHWSILNTLVYFYVRRLKKPYVVCPAGALPITGRSKFIKKIYNTIVGKSIIRNAQAGIAISTDEIQHFQSYGVNSDKVFHIPNGISNSEGPEIDASSFRRKYGLEGVNFILFMGRLDPIKGPDLLLEAFGEAMEALQPYHLLLVGPDGGLLASLQRTVAKHSTGSRVHLLGYLGGIEKQQALHAADLVVIPSRQEAMSIVVLEAGIRGTPVLITDQCGFDAIATINGGIVVPASQDGIKKGLVAILKNPEELRRKGENLKQYVSENYLWSAIIEKYLSLYHQILGLQSTA
jgi:glycosyltransferase involved in cell wall biosynthesis